MARQTNKNKKKKRKFMAIFFPILGAAIVATGVTLGCVYGCKQTPAWLKYFDDPGKEVRHQTASYVGSPVEYEFNLKEAVLAGEKVHGDVEVVAYSHPGVHATVTNFEVNEGQKKATFTAAIDIVPLTTANEATIYWADIKVEAKCKKTTGDETVWETTIEDIRVKVEIQPEPTYDEEIDLEYSEAAFSLTKNLAANKRYKIVADFTPWTSVNPAKPFKLEFKHVLFDLSPNYTINGITQGGIHYTETFNQAELETDVNLYFKHAMEYHNLYFRVGTFENTKAINIYLTFSAQYDNVKLQLLQPS